MVQLLSQGTFQRSTPSDYGDLTGMLTYTQLGNPGGMSLSHRFTTYGEIYKSQLWVATLVQKLARSASRLPIKAYRRTERGRDELHNERLAKLIARPCQLHSHYAKFFWLWSASTSELYGEVMWLKQRDQDGQVVGLFPLHPANLDIIREADGVRRYVWRAGGAYPDGRQPSWPAEDIVHIKSYNPDTLWRGLSPLEPLHTSLVAETSMRDSASSIWGNGARPSLVVKHPQTLSDPALQRLRAQIETQHTGTRNLGRPLLLEEGMEATVVQLSAREMEYVASLKLTREEACSLFDVPPPVVHILDRATFSNITEQMVSMYRDTMAPRLDQFESAINEQLVGEFPGMRTYVRFLMDDVLRGDFKARMEGYQKAINSGWMKPAEVRQAEDLTDAGELADQLYINSTMVPLGSVEHPRLPMNPIGDGDPDPVDRETPSSDETKAINVRSVLGRLGSVDHPSQVPIAALVAGLDQRTAAAVAGYVAASSNDGTQIDEVRAGVHRLLTEEAT